MGTTAAGTRTDLPEERTEGGSEWAWKLRVLVEEGQTIEEGDVVVVLEAMKMETEITAPRSGTISAVLVSAGDAVTGGQTLVEVD